MPISDRLRNLAPEKLPNRRADRFDGSGMGMDLTAFGPADRGRLARVYSVVNEFGHLPPDADARARLLAIDCDALMHDARAIGEDSPAELTREPKVRRLLHDVRGGGLQVLLGAAELLHFGVGVEEFLPNARSAARDHAKIMRAGFPDLDPEQYAADESARVHGVAGFAATWDGMTVPREGRAVSVSVECEYRGAITARCLETASIDRVMYNYVNNATRFAADGRVRVSIFRVGELVRWVVHNAVSPDHRRWLQESAGGDPRQLFRGGTTRGGNGVGLSGCADIVASCFGVEPAEALRLGHLGARLDESGFSAWFHWPAYEPAAVEEICACGASG